MNGGDWRATDCKWRGPEGKWKQKWRELEGNRVSTAGNGKEPSGEKNANNAGDWRGKECPW